MSNNDNDVPPLGSNITLSTLLAPTATLGVTASSAAAPAGKKAAKKPLTEEEKAQRKAKRNVTLASENYLVKTAKKKKDEEELALRYGAIIYPGTEPQLPATSRNLTNIERLMDKAEKEDNPITKREAAALLRNIRKEEATRKGRRSQYSPTTKLARNTAKAQFLNRKAYPEFKGLAATAARITKFLNLKTTKNLNNSKNRRNIRNTLKAIVSNTPRAKAKALAKAALETIKVNVQKELTNIAKERTIKTASGTRKTVKTINPASVKQLSELRQAGYNISASDFMKLSSLRKQNKLGDLMTHEAMKALLKKSEDMDACGRCLLTTIFGVAMD